jgi:hypothetical protein
VNGVPNAFVGRPIFRGPADRRIGGRCSDVRWFGKIGDFASRNRSAIPPSRHPGARGIGHGNASARRQRSGHSRLAPPRPRMPWRTKAYSMMASQGGLALGAAGGCRGWAETQSASSFSAVALAAAAAAVASGLELADSSSRHMARSQQQTAAVHAQMPQVLQTHSRSKRHVLRRQSGDLHRSRSTQIP